MNRPVHLACRDVYYEQAVEMIRALQVELELEKGLQELIQRYDKILLLLRTAREHAVVAARVDDQSSADQEFLEFIKTLDESIGAILAMIRQKQFLCREDNFLGLSPEIQMHIEEYDKRARDILNSIHDILELAGHSFQKLKKANLKSMEKIDRRRYNTQTILQSGKRKISRFKR